MTRDEQQQWEEDCRTWRGGRVLTGRYAHYCHDWDGLPVDETTDEWACCWCFSGENMDSSYVSTKGEAG